MGREMRGIIVGAFVSGGIHLVIFLSPISPTPALLVREIPGSIEVSLGVQRISTTTTSPRHKIEAAKHEPSSQAEARVKTPEVEDDTPRERNPDRRGDSSLAIPRHEGNPKPLYPEEARRRGYEGTVRLEVEVLASGRAGRIGVKKSSGHEVLDQSALKAVKEWRFIPARFGTVPVKSTVIIPVTFQLKD